MVKIPDMIFIIDTNVEELAVKEALKLNIPIVAIIDTNSDPIGINYPIPGNDDARRAINLYCELIKKTILDAQKQISKSNSEDLKVKTQKEEIKQKTQKEEIKQKEQKEIKKVDPKKKIKAKVIKKISKSIFSKVKSLASKKTK